MNQYKSSDTLQSIIDGMNPFVTSWLPEKPKIKEGRMNAMIDEYNWDGRRNNNDPKLPTIYDDQLAIVAACKNIQMSHLIGCNDTIVPILVEEYKALAAACRKLDQSMKRMNKFQETKNIIAGIMGSFSQKVISGCLYDDLNQLRDFHGIDIDIRACMTEYKNG